MIVILAAIVLSIPHIAQATPSSFELYTEGRHVQSVRAMVRELEQAQSTTRRLNRMLGRLNSSYEVELKVTDQMYLQALSALSSQQFSSEMEVDSNMLRSTMRALIVATPTVTNIETQINTNIETGQGVSRSIKFLALRLVALRLYLKSQNLASLYLAGVAGFYRANSGSRELERFVEECQNSSTDPACSRYLSDAQERLSLAGEMRLGD